MPRQPRYDLPGLPQHVIQRGNNRQAVFFEQGDCVRYLDDVDAVAQQVGVAIHAFVLMTNHVHLLVTPNDKGGISRLMQGMGRRYVGYVNGRYKRSGTLWEGRYKASLVDDEAYLLACMRYIELNPVRAGMVDHPGDYRWSSYATNARGATALLRLAPHERYLALGRDAASRQRAYRALFRHALAAEQVHEIRQMANSCLVLGNDRFRQQIAALTGQRTVLGKAGRPRARKSQSDPD